MWERIPGITPNRSTSLLPISLLCWPALVLPCLRWITLIRIKTPSVDVLIRVNKLWNWKNLEFQVSSEVEGRELQNTGAQVEFFYLVLFKDFHFSVSEYGDRSYFHFTCMSPLGWETHGKCQGPFLQNKDFVWHMTWRYHSTKAVFL